MSERLPSGEIRGAEVFTFDRAFFDYQNSSIRSEKDESERISVFQKDVDVFKTVINKMKSGLQVVDPSPELQEVEETYSWEHHLSETRLILEALHEAKIPFLITAVTDTSDLVTTYSVCGHRDDTRTINIIYNSFNLIKNPFTAALYMTISGSPMYLEEWAEDYEKLHKQLQAEGIPDEQATRLLIEAGMTTTVSWMAEDHAPETVELFDGLQRSAHEADIKLYEQYYAMGYRPLSAEAMQGLAARAVEWAIALQHDSKIVD